MVIGLIVSSEVVQAKPLLEEQLIVLILLNVSKDTVHLVDFARYKFTILFGLVDIVHLS